MTEHLTPLDGTFLELEEVDDSAHMHIGAIMVFDPPPTGGMPTREQLRPTWRIGSVGCPAMANAYHRRHRRAQLAGVGRRSRVRSERHIAHAALPAPGGERELAEWASQFFSQRLDRHRPLWEMTLLEGLAGGRWALATKTHHCMVDGVGSSMSGHCCSTSPLTRAGAPTRAITRRSVRA